MNETPKNRTGAWIRRAILIWLVFFVVINVAMVIADMSPKTPGRYSYPDQALIAAIGASLSLGLFFGLMLFWFCARWLCPSRRNFGRTLIDLAIFATLIAIFYTEENWRGRRAWENYKHELEAKGAVLDWDKFIPPPVPDDENFFKAPKMAEWFVRSTNATAPDGLYEQFKPESLSRFTSNNPVVLAEWTWLRLLTAKNIAAADSENADLVLKYSSFPSHPHSFTEANATPVSDEKPGTNAPIGLIQFQDMPITTVIENLARQAGINYRLDPKIGYGQPDKNGRIKPEPALSIRWKNITAREALLALLENYNLQLIEDPNNGAARITLKNSDDPLVYASPDLDGKITRLLQNVIRTFGTNMIGARGDRLLAKSPAEIKPARIILESGQKPDRDIIAWFTQCFPTNAADDSLPRIHIEPPVGTIPFPNTFRVILDSACSATEFLAWSDQAGPDFNLVREALKRPYARIDGDYSSPANISIPNFVTVRSMAQVLVERAQCHFLLNQPGQALDDLTRIHEMRLLLEGAPTHKPMTLVAAMINVAVAGLYTDTVAEGMRRHVWQDQQLSAIQSQLEKVNLAPYVSQAFREEEISTISFGKRSNFKRIITGELFNYGQGTTFMERMEGHAYDLIPQGWVYQNLIVATRLHQKSIDALDPANEQVFPKKLGQADSETEATLRQHSIFHLLAEVTIPKYIRAFQTLAYNQTLANQAQIACALERYHLAHDGYPETLDALTPQFIEKIPSDLIGGGPLHYHRTEDGKFLLYSIGWNETDDGGLPGTLKDAKTGDWVWR